MKTRLLLMVLGVVLAAGNAAAGFSIVEADAYLDVVYDGKIVARYMHAFDPSNDDTLHETYKPYLHVYDAAGKAPITKGSGGKYTHHRGIFAGWNKIQWNGASHDLWHMKGVYQVHREILWQDARDDGAGFTSRIEWLAPDGKPLMEEKRTMLFAKLSSGGGLAGIGFISELTAVRGDVLLDGDPEHAGVQYRPADAVDYAATKYAFPKENADPKKDRDYPWVGETYTLGGKKYSVVQINHPENPKDTIYSAYRDYGRLGAFVVKEIKEGELPAQSTIEAYYDDFGNGTYNEHPLDAPGEKPWMTGGEVKNKK